MRNKNDSEFRIIIIDDNPEIHKDFKKILTVRPVKSDKFASLESKLFDESPTKNPISTTFPVFVIDSAMQGEEGVEKVKKAVEANKPYSLAFVDVRMPPGIDGIETIKRILKIDPDIQIVICTAYSDYTWEETFERLKMEDNLLVLKKPFDNVAVRQLAFALSKKWILNEERKANIFNLEREVRNKTQSLQRSLSTTRATLESSGDGILVIPNDAKKYEFNQKFITMWGVPESLVENASHSDELIEYFLSKIEHPEKFKHIVKRLQIDDTKIHSGKLHLKDHRAFEFYTQPQLLNEACIGRVWSFRDITERVKIENELEHRATHDTLTNLPNRFMLSNRITDEVVRSSRQNTQFAVLFFDLDRFKLINDSLSHNYGDEVLKIVSERISKQLRKSDMLSRIGGDEFVVIISDLKDRSFLDPIINKILAAIEKPIHILDQTITTSASIGVSLFPENGRTADELVRNADLAMYMAKESHPTKYVYYAPDLHLRNLNRLELETDLREAIQNKQFVLCYQPQIRMPSGELTGYEALIRWNHPKKGVLYPVDFIPIAEETGLIIPIGKWLLQEACHQAAEWHKTGISEAPLAINVSDVQLKQDNFLHYLKETLSKTGLKPEHLVIELSEKIVISNPSMVSLLNDIIRLGVKIAFDDFGTGNSSLKYFRELPINQLKIDQTFIHNFHNNNDEVIIKAIISLAKSLNLEVIAEGVENQEQMDFLLKESCNEIQGYYFSEPLPASEFSKHIKNGKFQKSS